jgi:hypothetical protein
MSEDRVFPLALDPTIKVTSGNRGYCYVYYGYCYDNTYGLTSTVTTLLTTTCHGTSTPSHQASALPTGATIEEVNWKQYVNYGYGSSSSTAITSNCTGILWN